MKMYGLEVKETLRACTLKGKRLLFNITYCLCNDVYDGSVLNVFQKFEFSQDTCDEINIIMFIYKVIYNVYLFDVTTKKNIDAAIETCCFLFFFVQFNKWGDQKYQN